VLSKLPEPGESLESAPLDLLADGAFRLWPSEPARAATLFLEVARRLKNQTPDTSVTASIRAGLCLNDAGDFEHAKPLLDQALTTDWSLPQVKDERSLAETAITALMLHATGHEFQALWLLGSALGERVKLPFPSVWPNQEALLRRCAAIREFRKAWLIAGRIEEARDTLPRALSELIARIRREGHDDPVEPRA
jgi:tetratricopeptide (TPR) repeat protein